MKRKVLLVALAIFAVAVLLTGCGAPKQAEAPATTEQSAAQTPDATATEPAAATDTSLDDIKKKGEFILGLDDSFPPMGFRDEKNEIVGFDIDMAKEVAKRLGVKVTLKPIDWDSKVLNLNNKDIDVIWNGLTITAERAKEISYSKAYLNNQQILIVQANSTIATKADLKDKILGLQLGSSSEEALKKDTATEKSLKEVKKYGKYTEALLDLKSGRVDVVLIDEVVGRYYIAKKPGEFKVLAENMGNEEYGVGFRLNDTSFRTEVDKVMDEMKADGTADTISKKWFGEAIVKK